MLCTSCDEEYGPDTAVPASAMPGICASCAEGLSELAMSELIEHAPALATCDVVVTACDGTQAAAVAGTAAEKAAQHDAELNIATYVADLRARYRIDEEIAVTVQSAPPAPEGTVVYVLSAPQHATTVLMPAVSIRAVRGVGPWLGSPPTGHQPPEPCQAWLEAIGESAAILLGTWPASAGADSQPSARWL